MRRAIVPLLACLVGWAPDPNAAADWKDVPRLVAVAAAPVEAELRACVKKLPRSITLSVTRTKTGTSVGMPVYGVGYRGFTPEERCLGKTVAKIGLPALPAEIERLLLQHTIVAANAPAPATDKAFDDWRDPELALATVFDATRRTALAACDSKPRTVRLILDRRAGATRIWLPAWQFHAASGDGTTPAAERRVKACLTRMIRTWRAPPLPAAMGELEVAITTAP